MISAPMLIMQRLIASSLIHLIKPRAVVQQLLLTRLRYTACGLDRLTSESNKWLGKIRRLQPRISFKNELNALFCIWKYDQKTIAWSKLMPFELYISHYIWRDDFQDMINTIKIVIIFFIFRELRSHISNFNLNGVNSFCN